ncbi:MAG: threonine synthase, partial [Euryarchaeota archaeon]|nr:threonine synthase [Euryarchaeota archaeon]
MTVKGLVCRNCGREYPEAPVSICEECFGPLEVAYDYEKIKEAVSRKTI